jgi:hypothetical protein
MGFLYCMCWNVAHYILGDRISPRLEVCFFLNYHWQYGVFILHVLKCSTLHFGGQDQSPSWGLLLPKLCTNICFGWSLPENGDRSCPQDAADKFRYMWVENSVRAPSSNKNLVIRAHTRATLEKQLCSVIECVVVAFMWRLGLSASSAVGESQSSA